MQRLIQFALCGYCSVDYNPYAVTSDVDTQKILLAINSKTLTLHEISEETKLKKKEVMQHLKALDRCNLVKKTQKEGELYYQPGFAIFTLRDQKKLQPLIQKLSNSLVSIVRDFLPELREELKNIKCVKAGYRFPDLEYITIGAYAFDYGGLEVLKEEDLLTVSKEMPGGKYVFTGLETGLIDLKESWMWRHNSTYGKYTFSTHGGLPPKKRRRAFPDLGWFWTGVVDEEEKNEVKQKIVNYGDLLFKLLSGPMTLDDLAKELNRSKTELILDLTFLEELKYVISTTEQFRETKYRLNRPTLLLEDYNCIQRLSKRILRQFLNQSLKASYSELENLYKGTSPARNDIDIREAFNQIYHNIFEKALGKLMASEVITKPPLRRDGGRYSAWVAIGENT